MQDNRENGGGLFSDDYIPPKRENPYKKKKKITPAPVVEDNPPADVWDTDRGFAPMDEPADADGGESAPRKKPLKDRFDDFMFAHVKLMVFIAGVTVVVMLLGPFSVFRIAEWVEDAQKQSEMQDKGVMSLTYVKGLCRKDSPITWNDVEKFYYEDRSSDTYCTWIIPVEEGYEVWVGGGSTKKLPDYVAMYDSSTGRKVSLTEGVPALEAFLSDKD